VDNESGEFMDGDESGEGRSESDVERLVRGTLSQRNRKLIPRDKVKHIRCEDDDEGGQCKRG